MLSIVYEHPEWFELLFAELDRRGIPFQKIDAAQLSFDPEEHLEFGLVVNRMSPSAWKRGHANAIFAVRDYLAHVEAAGLDVVNGSVAYAVEISKARQLGILSDCGVLYPKARVINDPKLAMRAAAGLRFPIVVKPNIGGSGAGIVKFDSLDQVEAGVSGLNLGVDGTGLVQEFLVARDEHIVRVEILDGKPLYAIRIYPDFESFNLCPADICRTDLDVCPADAGPKRGLRIEAMQPPQEAIHAALALAKKARIDVGGFEYLVDDRTGQINFYDINALSNFVTDAVNVVGFDPTAAFVDYLERRMR